MCVIQVESQLELLLFRAVGSTSALDRMPALPDGLLGSLAASPAPESDMSGSFQSAYDYSGTGVDRSGHSGYNPSGVLIH